MDCRRNTIQAASLSKIYDKSPTAYPIIWVVWPDFSYFIPLLNSREALIERFHLTNTKMPGVYQSPAFLH